MLITVYMYNSWKILLPHESSWTLLTLVFRSKLQPRYCFDSSRIGDNENRKDTWHSGRTLNDAHNRRVLVDHPIATAALRCQCRFCCCWLREREGGKPHREKARRTDVKKKKRARRRCYRDGRASRCCFSSRPLSTDDHYCIYFVYRRITR